MKTAGFSGTFLLCSFCLLPCAVYLTNLQTIIITVCRSRDTHNLSCRPQAPHAHFRRVLVPQGRHKEQLEDASALCAEEGRGIATIRVGEPRAGIEPTISEWGNPTALVRLPDRFGREGTGGTETSHVPRGTESTPVVAASEPGHAQTCAVSS